MSETEDPEKEPLVQVFNLTICLFHVAPSGDPALPFCSYMAPNQGSHHRLLIPELPVFTPHYTLGEDNALWIQKICILIYTFLAR